MESIFLVKLCSRCDNNQPLSQFRKYKENSYSSVCKKCMNYMDKIRKQQLRQKRAETFMVKCEKCHEEKALKYFAKLKKFYKKKICSSCYPSFLTEQKTQWCKNQHNTNMNYRIKKSLAARLRNVLIKNTTTMEYIGCNISFFREWLQYNFTEDMNWSNYGSVWSIDHIIPVCNYDLSIEHEKLKCWNWSNMMPVSIHYNSSKKTIDIQQIQYIIKKLEKFKEEGSTTKWFSEEFLLTSQIDKLDLNSS